MNNNAPTSDGKPVSEETIDRLSGPEAGYDVDALRRVGGRRPMGSAAARVVRFASTQNSKKHCAATPNQSIRRAAPSSATRSAPGSKQPDPLARFP
jgi:hypothetical protein